MRPVLNLPMPPHERAQPPCIGALRCQTGAPSDDLLPHFARFGEDALALHLQDLGEARPLTLPCQHGTGLQPPLFDPTRAIVPRGSDRARFSGYGSVGTNGLHIFKSMGLVLFDDPDIVTPSLHHLLGKLALGQQRIHGDASAFQDPMAEQLHGRRHLVARVCHRLLGQGESDAMREGREEGRAWGSLLLAAPQRLAIKRDALEGVWRSRCPYHQGLSPCAQRRFQYVPVDAVQDRMERRGTRGLTRKAQGLYEGHAIIAAPLGERRLTPITTQHGAPCERQHRSQGVAFATVGAARGNFSPHRDQRTGICYHRFSSIGRLGLHEGALGW
jgi:hypothetical protein